MGAFDGRMRAGGPGSRREQALPLPYREGWLAWSGYAAEILMVRMAVGGSGPAKTTVRRPCTARVFASLGSPSPIRGMLRAETCPVCLCESLCHGRCPLSVLEASSCAISRPALGPIAAPVIAQTLTRPNIPSEKAACPALPCPALPSRFNTLCLSAAILPATLNKARPPPPHHPSPFRHATTAPKHQAPTPSQTRPSYPIRICKLFALSLLHFPPRRLSLQHRSLPHCRANHPSSPPPRPGD